MTAVGPILMVLVVHLLIADCKSRFKYMLLNERALVVREQIFASLSTFFFLFSSLPSKVITCIIFFAVKERGH